MAAGMFNDCVTMMNYVFEETSPAFNDSDNALLSSSVSLPFAAFTITVSSALSTAAGSKATSVPYPSYLSQTVISLYTTLFSSILFNRCTFLHALQNYDRGSQLVQNQQISLNKAFLLTGLSSDQLSPYFQQLSGASYINSNC